MPSGERCGSPTDLNFERSSRVMARFAGWPEAADGAERDEEGCAKRDRGKEKSDVSLHGWIPVGDMAGPSARTRKCYHAEGIQQSSQ